MKYELWAVKWDDAHYQGGEFDRSEIIHRPWIYISTGILVLNDATGITLAMDIGEDGRFRGTNFVPKLMIVDAWKVGPLEKRAPRKVKLKDERPPD